MTLRSTILGLQWFLAATISHKLNANTTAIYVWYILFDIIARHVKKRQKRAGLSYVTHFADHADTFCIATAVSIISIEPIISHYREFSYKLSVFITIEHQCFYNALG